MKENIYTEIKKCTTEGCTSTEFGYEDAEARGYGQAKHAGKTVLYCDKCGKDLRIF